MQPNRGAVLDALIKSEEPSIRWKALVRIAGEDPQSQKIKTLQEEIRNSARVTTLLAGRDKRPIREANVEASYRGAHWTFALLADIGYPAGDESLFFMRDQILDRWLAPRFYKEFESTVSVPKSRSAEGVPIIRGRYRRCASQQGNALLSLTKLGLSNKRSDALVERLLHWQWPDGGWNCDRKPSADTSSFQETWLAMLGLNAYAERNDHRVAGEAALRAAEVFLSRRLYKRRSTGKVIHLNLLMQHYPRFWHYDVLGGLVAMTETGLINDPRCQDALNLLEKRELPKGGWSADGQFYKVSSDTDTSSRFGSTCPVNWGGSNRHRMNEWVTADALYVLHAAGRA